MEPSTKSIQLVGDLVVVAALDPVKGLGHLSDHVPQRALGPPCKVDRASDVSAERKKESRKKEAKMGGRVDRMTG